MDKIRNQEHYINLSTRKRDGSFVNTPVWFAQEGETNNYYVYTLKKTGKVKRIRNFPDVKVATCNFSGKLKGDWIDARVDLIDESGNIKIAYSLLRDKYGIRIRIVDFFSWIVGNYHRRQIIRFRIKVDNNS
jgi:PPOX class probable F420-dependent enzyme